MWMGGCDSGGCTREILTEFSYAAELRKMREALRYKQRTSAAKAAIGMSATAWLKPCFLNEIAELHKRHEAPHYKTEATAGSLPAAGRLAAPAMAGWLGMTTKRHFQRTGERAEDTKERNRTVRFADVILSVRLQW